MGLNVMAKKTILVLGNDKLSQKAAELLQGYVSDIEVVIDRSTNWLRIFRLLRRKRLSASLLLKMFYCELRRPPGMKLDGYPGITGNTDLVNIIKTVGPAKVVLFRAGLIINQSAIDTGIPILNIHCARIPQFGGLGSIYRALVAGETSQCATLHRVTTTIDTGDVYDTENYDLDPQAPYCHNEAVAYEAGLVLLQRVIAG